MSLRHIKKNPVYYLQHLREQVKMKKSQTASFSNENVEREQNFKLFFSGANENRVQQKLAKIIEKSKSPYIKRGERNGLVRKRWGTPSTPNILKESQYEDYSYISGESDEDRVVEELVKRFKRLDNKGKELLLKSLKAIEAKV